MNAPADKYLNVAQQRILGLIDSLAGHELEGLAPSDIVKLQKCDPAQVTRDLANLKHFGWGEQIQSTGRWRLAPGVVRIATRYLTGIDRAERRVSELKQRFGSSDI